MEERLITLVKENTKRDNYEDNNASNLSNIIGLSRNSISSYLNDYFNQGRFVKINTEGTLVAHGVPPGQKPPHIGRRDLLHPVTSRIFPLV